VNKNEIEIYGFGLRK